MRGTWLVVAVMIGSAACGRGSGAGGDAVTRDSAGVSIVENRGSEWQSGQGWRVIDSALVDIGGDLDSVSGPVRLTNGSLAIANAGTHEVRIYDSSGAHLHTSGRPGSGPGEYQNLAGIWLGPGDSILVSDFLVRRLTVLDPDGTFRRSFSLGGTTGTMLPTNGRFELAIPQGWFADGSVAGVTMSFVINQTREGSFRDSVSALRYGPDGMVRDTLGRFPGAEMEQMTMTMGAQSFSAPTPVPLGRQSVAVAHGDRFYLAQNNAWEIEVRRLDGKLIRLIRADTRPRPITPGDIAAHRKAQLAQIEAIPMMRNVPEAMKSQIRTRIEQAKYPATLPFMGGLLIDAEGNIWAQEVQPPRMESSIFAVVDSSGRLLGRVTMPANFRAATIGTDAVYGVWRDSDDVQHVRVYRLRKGP
jgi:phage gpG-like protein